MIDIRGIQLPPGSITTQPSPLIVCINEEPTPFCERVFFSGCFCFISIGENDIISVHGRKDIGVRTAGREEEKKGWTVATSEVSMCCGARRGLRISGILPGLLWTGTHVGLGSSWGNRDLLFGRGGRCRIPPKKLLLCLFITLQRKQEEDLNEWRESTRRRMASALETRRRKEGQGQQQGGGSPQGR